MLRYLFLVLFFIGNCATATPMRINANLDERLIKYDFLLRDPGLILLAISNSGVWTSNTYQPGIAMPGEGSFGPVNFKYSGLVDQLHTYQIVLERSVLSIPRGEKINLNIGTISQGTATVATITMDGALLDYLPERVRLHAEAKLLQLISSPAQQQLLQYLETLPVQRELEGDIERAILTDSLRKYSMRQVLSKNAGSLRDQPSVFLSIVSLVLFGIGIVLAFFLLRYRFRLNTLRK